MARNKSPIQQDTRIRVEELRFITDDDYDPTTQKKPLLYFMVDLINGKESVRIQAFEACQERIGSLDPKSYQLIPRSLYDQWLRQEISHSEFLHQAKEHAFSPT